MTSQAALPPSVIEKYEQLISELEILEQNLLLSADKILLQYLRDSEPSFDTQALEAAKKYQEEFGKFPEWIVRGTGRAEIIGNMVDQLEGGIAIGTPIEQGIAGAVGVTTDDMLTIHSAAVDDSFCISISDLSKINDYHDFERLNLPDWAKYCIAVLKRFEKQTEKIQGMNIWLESDLPTVGGVSSSAALEMAIAYVYLSVTKQYIEPDEIVRLCYEAENSPIVQGSCGYLDQACSNGAGPQLLEFTASGFEAQTIDLTEILEQNGYSLIIATDEEVSRQLDDTGYPRNAALAHATIEWLKANELYDENRTPEDNLQTLMSHMNDIIINIERDKTFQEAIGSYFDNQAVGQRAYQVVYHLLFETVRVKAFSEAVAHEDIQDCLRLINLSGESSLNNYGVASNPDVKQLKWLINNATDIDGIEAIRNHGGGWNATILLVMKTDKKETALNKLRQQYKKEFPNGKLIDILIKPSIGSLALPYDTIAE